MKKFSEISDNFSETSKDRTLKEVQSITGLPDGVVSGLYESMKIDNLSDSAVVEYFKKASEPKTPITCGEFFKSILDGISGVEATMDSVKKTGVTRGILNALDDISSGASPYAMEPGEMLAAVKTLIEVKNPKAKGLLSTDNEAMLRIVPVEHDFAKLNEAFEDAGATTMLFEGLKHILAKNNRRWGNAYRISNSYEEIMRFVDKEIEDIELKKSIVSIEDGFHMELLNDLLSSNVNPIYKSINGVRQLIPDLQTLLFDMTLLVNVYMQSNQYAMQYLSRIAVNDYRVAAMNLLASISSSHNVSKILYTDAEQCNMLKCCDDRAEFYDNFLTNTTNRINEGKLKYPAYNMSLKSAVDMIYLIKSMSSDFNLKIRPFIRDFVTKSLNITGQIERAKREMATFRM